jgi:integrase
VQKSRCDIDATCGPFLYRITSRVDGGLELPLKVVQARLDHASIQMTADRYGHLFPRGDDGAELATAERAFLGG